MSDLWERWKAHYQSLGITAGICEDGILSENADAFRHLQRRVLFVLKDTNGGPYNLTQYLKDGPHEMFWNVARWAFLILNAKGDCIPPYPNNHNEVLKEALANVAVINLKKTPGRRSLPDTTLHVFAHQDQALLHDQVNAISPNIIVAGGTFLPLMWLLDLKVDTEPSPPEPGAPELGPVRDKARKAWVIPMRHPAHDNAPETSYQKLGELWHRIRII